MDQLTPGIALGFLLVDTARLFRRAFESAIEKSGIDITPGEVRTLAYVVNYEGSRQSFLAELMGVEPMTLSAYIDRLERLNLVIRESDRSDRRAKVIRATEAVDDIFAKVRPMAQGVYNRATRKLSESEKFGLESSLKTMIMNLDQSESFKNSLAARRSPVT